MTDKYKRLQKKLSLIFWVNIILFTAAFLIVLYIKGLINLGNGVNVAFEQYSIIFTIIGIPGALKLFHSIYKKAESSESEIFLKKYFNAYMLRLLILDTVIILNIAGIYSLNSQNALYMTIITIFALVFCYPSKNSIETNKNLNNN